MKSTTPDGARALSVTAILWGVLSAVLWAALLAGPKAASAAELVLFESDTCEWCERFHKEVGPAYPNTAEAKCAPLRRVDIHDPRPDDLTHIKGIVFTPTFVLIEGGQEVSRLVGYPGEDFFWSLLERDLKKLRQPCAAP
tara:strand:- start:92932 stop:93351 length:420 start_codon:yes stop_codon:yes gene_type:complete